MSRTRLIDACMRAALAFYDGNGLVLFGLKMTGVFAASDDLGDRGEEVGKLIENARLWASIIDFLVNLIEAQTRR